MARKPPPPGGSPWALSKRIETFVVIQADPALVWSTLTDFRALPEWNTFLRIPVGEAREGSVLEVTISIPGSRSMKFKPTVLRALPNRELRWLGRVLMPGLFDGEHWFRVTPQAGGTRFEQCETFSGILVPFVMGGFPYRATQRAFESFNASLKARVETLAAAKPAAGVA